MNRVKDFVVRNFMQYGMLLILVLVMIVFAFITQGKLILPRNVSMLIRQNAYVFILAIGMMLCILTGGNIDLSVGALVALVGAVSGTLATTLGLPDWLAIVISLLTGLAAGMWQGFWIAFVKVPPFITTLSGMLVFRGINNIILNGQTIGLRGLYEIIGNGSVPDIAPKTIPDFLNIAGLLNLEERREFLNATALFVGIALSVIYVVFAFINRRSKRLRGYEVPALSSVVAKSIAFFIVINVFSYWLAMEEGIPYLLVIVAILFAVYSFIATKTIPGRHIYAMGGNAKAAQLSGVNNRKMMFLVYSNMGFMAAIAAVVYSGRSMSASPTAGVNFELDAIGACFIGGASAYGGVGTIWGAIIGAFMMGVMNNAMSIAQSYISWLDIFAQQVAKGLLVLLAVAFDMWTKSKTKIK